MYGLLERALCLANCGHITDPSRCYIVLGKGVHETLTDFGRFR